jgi:ribonuclease HI
VPWVEANLRGQKVFARTRADGSLDATGGRVEIRYKQKDARAYRAAANNLLVATGSPIFPDDHCVEGEAVDASKTSQSKIKTAKAAKLIPSTKITATTWIAYTDGACSGNPGPCGLGFVVVKPGGEVHEAYEYLGIGTNNVAELAAIMRAVEKIPADAPNSVVHTDSKYAIGVLSQNWKAKANQDLITQTKKVLATRSQVSFVYVPGHAGVPLNERADQLAREAIKTRSKSGID